jgi:fructose-1,6-bisphosphatase/inositol monophosphatase family enzyme
MLPHPDAIVARLRDLQRQIRDVVVRSRQAVDLHAVSHQSSADTIYKLDLLIEPVIEEFCEEWGREMPLVVVAEGIEPETGRVFPAGADESDAKIRIIMDPVDGTRGLMYDKRAAWSLAGAAPNKGDATRLSDIEVAVMTELPTSKMGHADVLWAIKGRGAKGVRESLDAPNSELGTRNLELRPSTATTIAHGFATVSNFFPGTKELASRLMEHLVLRTLGEADVKKATVFDDQYISTGGQFYELIVGHDRFIADLRPLFYAMQNQGEGLCCHPYDCATMLIATEAGVVITDGQGQPLDGPMDVTTGLSWAAFANEDLRRLLEPLIMEFVGRPGR